MKVWVFTALFCITAHAADEKKPELKCEGYTMYTHPDEYCKSILQKEYKEMVKRYLEAKKAKGK